MKCSIKGCNEKADLFLKTLKFCHTHALEIGLEQEASDLKAHAKFFGENRQPSMRGA